MCYNSIEHFAIKNMIKSLTIATALLLGSAFTATAAEIGVRHESGYSWNSATHGRASESYNGRSRTRTNSVGIDYTGGGAGRPAAGGGAGSIEVVTTNSRSSENFSGQSSNRFTGGSSSAFSGTSIFAN